MFNLDSRFSPLFWGKNGVEFCIPLISVSVVNFSFRIEDHLKKLYLIQQELLNEGLVIQAQEAHDIAMNYSGDNMRFDDDKIGSFWNICEEILTGNLNSCLSFFKTRLKNLQSYAAGQNYNP